ncbi:hypothetical protein NA655_10690 [Pseudomonas kuykendallii]|uniref:hypothetical protein n=1 Tax=Pseudomonas kuykendallii TaxID=1007099 RepID=UPI0011134B33|nr:hypothetical protein [Pseudomonas kuykendallii]MCQ4271486.1 hypothetical protein [Pseudomonas kuykendallii]
MSEPFNKYSQKLTFCMMTYQFIEFGLKHCLIRCHATVKFRLDGYLPYEIPLTTIEDAPLGKLIELYKPYTTNTPLIQELRKIKKDRDMIAHQGYLLTLEEQADGEFLIKQADALEASHRQADECMKKLHIEMGATDRIVSDAYAELRSRRLDQGDSLPESPNIPAIVDLPPR